MSDMNAILIGMEGRQDMLQAVLGKPDDAPSAKRPRRAADPSKLPPLTSKVFDAHFGSGKRRRPAARRR